MTDAMWQQEILIDDCIFNAQPFLSPVAFCVQVRLKAHSENYVCQVSNQELQLLCNISKNTVSKAINELLDSSILFSRRNVHEASSYHININHLEEFVRNKERWTSNQEDKKTYRKKRINQSLRTQVFERDKYRCVNCDAHKNLCADHIVAESKSGATTLDNLQTLCQSCNSSKGTKPMNEWLGSL